MSEFLLTVSNFIYGNTGIFVMIMFLVCGSNLGLSIFMYVSRRAREGLRVYFVYLITKIINVAFFVLGVFAVFSFDDKIGLAAAWSLVVLQLGFWPSFWMMYLHEDFWYNR